MSGLRVLIVGASIAGPTAAYWLAKAGAKVTIVERFPQMRIEGQNIDIRTAGVTVMRKMEGMEELVRANNAQIDGMAMVRSDGRPYGTIMPTGNADQQSLVSEFEIYRGDLARILYDMTKDHKNIKYVFEEQVSAIRHHEKEEGPITVEFANGRLPTSEYDLVVACDGATSRTRALGLGCGARDYVHPINAWAAYFTADKPFLNGSKIGQGFGATGGRFMAIGTDRDGERSRVMFMQFCSSSNADRMVDFRAAQKQGNDALKAHIAGCFGNVGWKVGEALECMVDSNSFYASEIVQVKPPSLSKGRFVMVGDAGYAPGPTGSGTTLAIAGAYILAGEICQHKGDLAAGLRGYEEEMKPLIKELQQIPPMLGAFMAPQTAWGLWLRNHIFAFIAWSRIIEFAQRFFAGAFAHTDQYKLKDYPWIE